MMSQQHNLIGQRGIGLEMAEILSEIGKKVPIIQRGDQLAKVKMKT